MEATIRAKQLACGSRGGRASLAAASASLPSVGRLLLMAIVSSLIYANQSLGSEEKDEGLRYYCGYDLIDALALVCDNRYYAPKIVEPTINTHRKRHLAPELLRLAEAAKLIEELEDSGMLDDEPNEDASQESAGGLEGDAGADQAVAEMAALGNRELQRLASARNSNAAPISISPSLSSPSSSSSLSSLSSLSALAQARGNQQVLGRGARASASRLALRQRRSSPLPKSEAGVSYRRALVSKAVAKSRLRRQVGLTDSCCKKMCSTAQLKVYCELAL